ncbi:hypothetical protein ACLMJK_005626 [Lecanora helva]
MRSAGATQLLDTFKVLPEELFRVNKGHEVALRAFITRPKRKFDLLTEDGMVLPKALNPATTEWRFDAPE